MNVGPEYTYCRRCRRPAPDQASQEFLDWEATEEGYPICPGCLTGREEQAMAEDAMDTLEAIGSPQLPGSLPAPGLDGTYSGSCIVCLNGCDTGLAFVGPAEWAIAGLTVLGVPKKQAPAIVIEQLAKQYGITEPDTVPDGDVTVGVSVCQSCVDKCGTRFPLGLISTGEVPGIRSA